MNKYDILYNNVRTDSDRYLYTLLFGEQRIYDKLSPDSKLGKKLKDSSWFWEENIGFIYRQCVI